MMQIKQTIIYIYNVNIAIAFFYMTKGGLNDIFILCLLGNIVQYNVGSYLKKDNE